MNIQATRDLIELICKKFGRGIRIEIYSDGSGYIYNRETTRIDEYLLEFDGLDELAKELGE